jgi:hypothetical protein
LGLGQNLAPTLKATEYEERRDEMKDYDDVLHEIAEEQLHPIQGGNRIQHGGFWDSANAEPSEPTSFDPDLVTAYRARQQQLKQVGKWRRAPAAWKHNDGEQIDCDWRIMEW